MSKVLIIGDVHANLPGFRKAVQFASSNNMHLICVGDLIDNGNDGPAVTKMMLELVKQNKASLIVGNHEWKIIRWIKGNDVKITPPNQITVDQMNNDSSFLENFKELFEFTKDFIKLSDSIYITHAAVDKSFWNSNDVPTKKDLAVFKHGVSDTSKIYHYRGETYPIRVYDWVNDVPAGIKLFVGHDPRPMIGVPDFDNFQSAPEVVTNDLGGTVTFLDCGSGKGGSLCGVVLNTVTNESENFINFGN